MSPGKPQLISRNKVNKCLQNWKQLESYKITISPRSCVHVDVCGHGHGYTPDHHHKQDINELKSSRK